MRIDKRLMWTVQKAWKVKFSQILLVHGSVLLTQLGVEGVPLQRVLVKNNWARLVSGCRKFREGGSAPGNRYVRYARL